MGILQELDQDRTLIMGILNVTPDSFSDGGRHQQVDRALAHAHTMLEEGADIIDIGGESTRPGATPVGVAEELRRVIPVIKELAGTGAVLSIDTLHAETAAAALEAGAHIINDVSGERLSEQMIAVAAQTKAPYVLTHARGDSHTMNSRAQYTNTVVEVIAELQEWTARLTLGGVEPENIIVDPGLGFAKLGAQDWQLLAGMKELNVLGYPLLIGASRKRMLATVLAQAEAERSGLALDRVELREPADRDIATAALSALAAANGAWAVRVHNVRASADALAVARAWNGVR